MNFSKINISNIPATHIFAGACGSALVIFLWEHIARKRNWNFRPSIGLEYTSKKLRPVFSFVGEKFAWTSSYLTKINLQAICSFIRNNFQEIWTTICDLVKPIFGLVTSPFCVITSYVTQTKLYKERSWSVYLGSALIVVLLAFGYYGASKRYPVIDFWTSKK